MGVWIDYEGNETLTDPETGEIIDEDRTVRDFAASMLSRHERGESIEQLAASTALDRYLILVALDIALTDWAAPPHPAPGQPAHL